MDVLPSSPSVGVNIVLALVDLFFVTGANEYSYLLSMPIVSLTLEKVNDINEEWHKKQAERKVLEETSIYDIWRTDLDALEEQLDAEDKFYEEELKEHLKNRKQPQAGAGGGKKGIHLSGAWCSMNVNIFYFVAALTLPFGCL